MLFLIFTNLNVCYYETLKRDINNETFESKKNSIESLNANTLEEELTSLYTTLKFESRNYIHNEEYSESNTYISYELFSKYISDENDCLIRDQMLKEDDDLWLISNIPMDIVHLNLPEQDLTDKDLHETKSDFSLIEMAKVKFNNLKTKGISFFRNLPKNLGIFSTGNNEAIEWNNTSKIN